MDYRKQSARAGSHDVQLAQATAKITLLAGCQTLNYKPRLLRLALIYGTGNPRDQGRMVGAMFRAPRSYCVWVLECGVFGTSTRWGKNEIAWWEIWSAHNTRREAIEELKKRDTGEVKICKRFRKAIMRIRKYVPEVPNDRTR